ncbi:MAG TPA: hypothetical protein VMX14_08295 [Anaerolineae bacterium]|nr:hypothetical protein [Anaerolineae bacterium]
MKWLLTLDRRITVAAFVVANLVFVGMGMGVPIFCIVFGFFVGWYIVKRVSLDEADVVVVLQRTSIYSLVVPASTLVLMLVMWGPTVKMLFDPAADLANFGTPLILYEPKASFVGWLVLMIFISPFLQLLTSLFSSHCTIIRWLQRDQDGS